MNEILIFLHLNTHKKLWKLFLKHVHKLSLPPPRVLSASSLTIFGISGSILTLYAHNTSPQVEVPLVFLFTADKTKIGLPNEGLCWSEAKRARISI